MDEREVGRATTADDVHAVAGRARDAAAELGTRTRADKDAALHAMAEALTAHTEDILAANSRDVAAGRAEGMAESLIDRLALDADRIAAMATGWPTSLRFPIRSVRLCADTCGRTGWRSARCGSLRRRRDDLRGTAERHR